jgi:hypothetical protein
MEWYERGSDRLGYSERDFKVCDFCGALNPVSNHECFVCGWSGQFHNDRETVRDVMSKIEGEYGALDEELFMDETLPSTLPRGGLWTELWASFKRLFSRA